MKKYCVFIFLLTFFFGASLAFGMGERPELDTSDFSDTPVVEATPSADINLENSDTTELVKEDSVTSKQSAPAPAPLSAPPPPPPSSESAQDYTGDPRFEELHRQYAEAIKGKQFLQAHQILYTIPSDQQLRRERLDKPYLDMFKSIENELANVNPLLLKDEDLEESVRKVLAKLYREAQASLLQGKQDIAKDLLIHMLFLNRRDSRAKKLLEYGLDLRVGSYKVEDIESKYRSKSSTFFYGGNYLAAVDVLTTLVLFNKEDPLIYERLGSSYYMMGEKQKAIDAWSTALFFNPDNKQLEKIIQKARDVLLEEQKESKEERLTKKKINISVSNNEETQLLGIYKTQNDAYIFAAELKKQGMSPLIEETETGKWSVKVPKKQLKKK